ncbi:hypothetical protein [Pseudobdellovibrio exovorus]|uniref:Uncharacterized protein n=1 Tax=Pseudobdellovibrio exovorus JSS TaxID=1184267 RepID=M4V606_9BACT|nr:hypothetical protein [Pseudobdellovibrio exovorus]AGH94797.1 hypothetical protein A11Q_577 [Pseudobdellovibrio exovorus JSS]
MKKLFLLSAALLLFVLEVGATTTGQTRACRIAGGQYFEIEFDFDEIGLCLVGESLVGSRDLLNKNARIEIPLSLHHYRRGVRTCTAANMQTLQLGDLGRVDVCLYSDGSVIDLATLLSGKEHNRNAKLNKALGL